MNSNCESGNCISILEFRIHIEWWKKKNYLQIMPLGIVNKHQCKKKKKKSLPFPLTLVCPDQT